MTTTDYITRAQSYGVRMNEALSGEEIAAHHAIAREETVDWSDEDLKRITRWRLIGASREYPFWDESYCHGELKDGTQVRVRTPFYVGDVRLPRYNWKRVVVETAKRDGVYAKGLGFLDEGVVSLLWG